MATVYTTVLSAMDSKGFGEAGQESRGRIEQADDEMVVCTSSSDSQINVRHLRLDDDTDSRNIEVEALAGGGK